MTVSEIMKRCVDVAPVAIGTESAQAALFRTGQAAGRRAVNHGQRLSGVNAR